MYERPTTRLHHIYSVFVAFRCENNAYTYIYHSFEFYFYLYDANDNIIVTIENKTMVSSKGTLFKG
jgi:hypothetical protein